MAFNPFKFIYNKPKTIPKATELQAPATAIGSLQSSLPQSRALDISNKLKDLIETSRYLQAVIVDRLKSKAVVIDPAVDPETARALMQTYRVSQPPSAITVPMFNSLLDADIGVMQLNSAAGNDLPVEANPYQAKDLLQITQTVEQSFVADGSYTSALAMYLRPLKGDAAMFQAWDFNLQTYPVMTPHTISIDTFRPSVLQAANIDISHDLYNTMDDYTQRYAEAYSGIYQSLAEVNHVEQDISSVVNEYFYQPIENVVRIVGMLNALKGLAHADALGEMADDLANYSYVRLSGESSGLLFNLDQLIQITVQPLKTSLGSLGRIVSLVQGVGNTAGRLASGGLKGMISNNACASDSRTKLTTSQSKTIPELSSLSNGVRSLAEHLDWATRTMDRKMATTQKQFLRLNDRRLSAHSDKLNVMCSLGALETLMNLAKSFASETQSGSGSASPTPAPTSDTINRILSNMQTGTSTTFVAQSDGGIVANAPDMPSVSGGVSSVLARGGIVPVEQVL